MSLQEPKVIRKELPSSTSADIHPDEAPYRPFDNFPPELLSYILTLAWNSYDKNESLARFVFPSSFSQVNHYFNLTVLSTPTLWSHLQITSVSGLAHIQDRIQNKCGVLPLDIWLIFHRTAYPDARQMLEATMAWASFRCRSLVLRYKGSAIVGIPENGRYWDHLQVFTLSNPLRTVRLSIEAAGHLPLDNPPYLDASVRFVSFSLCLLRWAPTTLPVNIEELLVHERERTYVNTAEIASCLHGSLRHSLRSLSLSGFNIVDGGIPEASCCLELLENLELEMFCLGGAALLLDLLFTPNLHRLSLHVVPGGPVYDTTVATWSNLRFPNLRKLKLRSFQTHTRRLIELVQNLPSSVRYLEVIKDGPVQALSDQSTTALCGQLHHLVIHDVPLHPITRLVEGRCASLQTLTARYITAADAYPDLDRSQLWGYLDVLETHVPQLTIVVDGWGPGADEPKRLTSEELKENFLQATSESLNSV